MANIFYVARLTANIVADRNTVLGRSTRLVARCMDAPHLTKPRHRMAPHLLRLAYEGARHMGALIYLAYEGALGVM